MAISAVDATTRPADRGYASMPAPPARDKFEDILASTRQPEHDVAAAHVVKAGETLSEIVYARLKSNGTAPTNAELYDAVSRVAAVNGLSDPDRIYPGQEISFEDQVVTASAPVEPAPELLVAAMVPPSTQVQPEDVGGPKVSVQSFATTRLESFRQVATELSDAISHPIRYAKSSEALMRFLPSSASRNEAAALASLKTAEEQVLVDESATPTVQSPWKRILAQPAHLTSEFGPRCDPFDGTNTHHDGIDLAVKRGTKIYPYENGTVEFSGWKPGYGNVVVVKHADGLETVYGHNSKNLVKAGDKVNQTDVLATVGSTGRSTGPHLHFEIRQRGRAVDPVPHMTEIATSGA